MPRLSVCLLSPSVIGLGLFIIALMLQAKSSAGFRNALRAVSQRPVRAPPAVQNHRFSSSWLRSSAPAQSRGLGWVRHASSSIFGSGAAEYAVNESVSLSSGARGTILRKNEGWYSVAVDGTNEIQKVRSTGIQSSLSKQSESSSSNPFSTHSDECAYPPLSSLPVIDPPAPIKNCDRWVVFSDLHVKRASVETCEKVLSAVHAAALERGAGIIFLGDFWHVRGALSVELLNRVMRALREWTQPVIMIPGNHDQVSLGGTSHSLTPLTYAFPRDKILMIDEPALCKGALWLPYRRDKQVMKQVLDYCRENSEREKISMIFCHADVQGAWMNDNIQSREGLDVQSFPPSIPVYSGHFHKPHLIKKREHSLRYVGSPYQTSLSEADQTKYLYCLQSPIDDEQCKWKQVEQWPVSIGRRYMKIHNLDDARLSLASTGDRVVLMVPIYQLDAADNVARRLKQRGVEVEVRSEKISFHKQSSVSISSSGSLAHTGEANDTATAATLTAEEKRAAESDPFAVVELDPINLFRQFMSENNVTQFVKQPETKNSTAQQRRRTGTAGSNDTTAVSDDFVALLSDPEALKKTLVEEGVNTLERLLGNADLNSSTGAVGAGEHKINAVAHNNVNNAHYREIRDLQLESVNLHNFGPYGGERVHYPLAKRGLVLIRGQSSDGTGADSNGSGKTTLAMSILWALTGSMDTRLISDARSAEVAFDGDDSLTRKRTAEVRLRGEINGQPFELVRRKGPKKQELYFSVNGQDLTTQSVKDTQNVVDRVLGTGNGLLQRCYFFGQHSHTSQSLLGLTDSRLKEELSPLINTDVWIAAASHCRARERALRTEILERDAELRVLLNLRDDLVAGTHPLREKLAVIEKEIEREERERDVRASDGTHREGEGERATTDERLLRFEAARRELETERERHFQQVVLPLRERLTQNKSLALPHTQAHRSDTSHSNAPSSTQAHTQHEPLSPERMSALQSQLRRVETQLASANTNHSLIREELLKLRTKRESDVTELRRVQKDVRIALLPNTSSHNTDALTDTDTHTADKEAATEYCVEELSALHSETHSAGERVRKESTAALMRLSVLDEKIVSLYRAAQKLRHSARTLSAALSSLTHAHTEAHSHTDAPHTTHTHTHKEGESESDCPTCGQALPQSAEYLAERAQTLESELRTLLQTRLALQYSHAHSAQHAVRLHNAELSLRDARSLAESLSLRESESESLHARREELDKGITQLREELLSLQRETDAETERQRAAASALQADLSAAEREQDALRARLRALDVEEQKVRREVESEREKERRREETLRALRERAQWQRARVSEQEEKVAQNEQRIANVESEKRMRLQQALLQETLSGLFGSRGVQHFLLQSATAQLEVLANNALSALTDGGVQLSLVSDAEQERVLKTVRFRSPSHADTDAHTDAQSQWKERALSQLSGGQWRRVSLSLDLAFTELVRRRGVLRCNVLVMDEVLTHLDAQGREAVGSVLKSLVVHSHAHTHAHREAEGEIETEREREVRENVSREELVDAPFETILVILQDLAASELEEDFDCIDVVVKQGEASRVVIDGEKQ